MMLVIIGEIIKQRREMYCAVISIKSHLGTRTTWKCVNKLEKQLEATALYQS